MGLIRASRWRTILDLDFTAEANHTFNPSGGVALDSNGAGPGGFTWYTFGSGSYVASTANVNGTGVVVQPGNTTDYAGATRTFCGIFLPLSVILPAALYDPSMGLRLWAYNSVDNTNANYDNAVIAIDSADGTALQYVQKRGHGTAGNGIASYLGNQSSNVSGFLSDSATLSGASSRVMVVETPSLGDAVYSSYFGQYSGGWPSLKALSACTGYKIGNGTGYIRSSANAGLAGVGFSLGAQRAGSATALSITFARMRVDVRT